MPYDSMNLPNEYIFQSFHDVSSISYNAVQAMPVCVGSLESSVTDSHPSGSVTYDVVRYFGAAVRRWQPLPVQS